MIEKNNHTVSSALIGQSITEVKYFHGGPSATTDTPYNGLASSGNNLACNIIPNCKNSLLSVLNKLKFSIIKTM
ncbi:MAG: potassium-transporting ATPase subunit C [Candidatus Phlomobacter fragariae]